MYICVCKGVTEKDLNEVVKTFGSSLEQVQNSCGAATDCGSCLVKLEKFLQRATPSTATTAAHTNSSSSMKTY